jgi:hypothetical protein
VSRLRASEATCRYALARAREGNELSENELLDTPLALRIPFMIFTEHFGGSLLRSNQREDNRCYHDDEEHKVA